MNNLKYKRLDYPGHCLDVRAFDTFSSNRGNTSTLNNVRILIVTNRLSRSEQLDSAINLCFTLANEGRLNVDILSVEENTESISKWNELKSKYQLDSSLIVLPRELDVLKSPIADELEDSYHLNHWLNKAGNKYQIIISLDCLALMYYPLLSRKTLNEHYSKKFIVFAKSSSYFNLVKSSQPALNPSLLNRFYAEQQVIELSDYFISNSQHYLNWMIGNEIKKIPNHIYYQQMPYFFSLSELSDISGNTTQNSVWLFLFGEECDTEIIFCIDALKRLKDFSVMCKFIFTSKISRKKMKRFRSLAIGINIELIEIDEVHPVCNTLLEESSLVVIPNKERLEPSLISQEYDDSNFVLENGYDQKSNTIKTFIHNPEVIKKYLQGAINNDEINIIQKNKIKDSWVQLINSIENDEASTQAALPTESIKVTVCISHYNRGGMLLRAIDSITNQTYPCYEIIVVDDGSNDEDTLQILSSLEKNNSKINLRVIKQSNLYIGASRNTGIDAAQGDYILFMDDDNEAMPEALDVFVKAINVIDADILTCLSQVFSGSSPENSVIKRQHALFVGPNTSSSLISNPFGDSNMFAKLESIRRIGGFSEFFKVGRDDHEFFVRACLNGLKIELIPRALYNYCLSKNRIRDSHINLYSGLSRVMQSYSQQMDVSQSQQLRYAQGISYAAGPWGTSVGLIGIKQKVIEFARMYVAKFPSLYNLAMRVIGKKN